LDFNFVSSLLKFQFVYPSFIPNFFSSLFQFPPRIFPFLLFLLSLSHFPYLFLTNYYTSSLFYHLHLLLLSFLYFCIHDKWHPPQQQLNYTSTHIRVLFTCSPYTSHLLFPSPLLLLPHLHPHSHYFYCLSFDLSTNNFYFSNTLSFIDNTAKDFIFHINFWFSIEFMNLLLLSYIPRSVD
jgi:hypothetical protein